MFATAVTEPQALLAYWTTSGLTAERILDGVITEMAAAGRTAVADPETQRASLADLDGALGRGFEGWLADAGKLAHPWGLPLQNVTVPGRGFGMARLISIRRGPWRSICPG